MRGLMRNTSFESLLLFAAGALGALSGCAPQTQYRYSASVPAVRPIAWDGRTPKGTSVTVEGTLTHTDIGTKLFPQPHDTAVWVPEWTGEATALLAVSSHVQLGLRGAYASYEWARASAAGTMPVPGASATTGFGPEVRLSFPLDPERRWAIGIAGNYMLYQVPYAEWTLTGPGSTTGTPACAPSPTCVADYALHDTRTEGHWVYDVGIYPSYAIGDGGRYGHVIAQLGATSGFKNDGFTDQPSNGSTVDSVGPIFILGIGYGIRYDVMHATALLYRPMTDSDAPVQYNVGLQLALGVDFDMSSHDDDVQPRPAPRSGD
jgi:hypothetical protein